MMSGWGGGGAHPGLRAAAGDEADGAEGDVDEEPAAEARPCLEVAVPVERRDLAGAVRRRRQESLARGRIGGWCGGYGAYL